MPNQLAYRGPQVSTVQADGGLGRHAVGIRPGDALFKWRRMYAQRNLRAISVGILGDSISFGSGATGADGKAAFQNTFAVRLGQMLNGIPYGINPAGDADLFDMGSGYHVRAARNTSAPDPWTRSTSPADTLIARGTGGQSTGLPYSTTSATISFKSKSCTGFLLAYEDGVGAVAPRVQVTGSTGKAVLSQAMTMNTGLAQYTRSTFGAFLPRGTYTITLSNSTTAGTAVVDGLYVFDGDANSGVVVMNHAFPGNTTDTFVGATTQASTLKASVSSIFNPDLLIINIGANDYMNGVVPATFQANVSTMIDSYRTQVGNALCPVLLCSYFARYDITSPTYPWSQYAAALRAVAAAKTDVEFLDLAPFFAATQTADDADFNMIDTGGVHLANRGHNLYAQVVADRLLAPISIT
jgi:lysophospholipase L1-like esterase